jgi:hypothetical protein
LLNQQIRERYLAQTLVVMLATNGPGCWYSLLAGTGLVMQLDRVSQTFHEPPVVERLAQEVDRSVIERTSPVFVVWVCGNQNHRHLISPRPQRFLQLKPALSGHLQISDKACACAITADWRKCSADVKVAVA